MSNHPIETGAARCTLPTSAAIEARLDEWATLRRYASAIETTDDSITMVVPRSKLDDVEKLVAKESVCCEFLRFSIDRAADHVAVTISSDVADARRVLHALAGRPIA